MPYPSSRVNPANQSLADGVPPEAVNRVVTFFTFTGGQLVPHVFGPMPPDSCPMFRAVSYLENY